MFSIGGSDMNDTKDDTSSIPSTIHNAEWRFEQYMRVEIPANNDFDLLSWSEINKDEFPTLAKVARSILYTSI